MKKIVILALVLSCNMSYAAQDHDVDKACNYDAECIAAETEAATRIAAVADDMKKRGVMPFALIMCVRSYSGDPDHMMRGIVECAGI